MERLTKENFWNDLHDKHPEQMNKFCKWIDEYKERELWNILFARHTSGLQAPKYHELPIAMQIGIFLQYVSEADTYDGIELPKVSSKVHFERIPEYIKDFFAYESAIQTHRSPVHAVRLQSDEAQAQNPDPADIKGTDGGSDEANEEGQAKVDD